MFAAQCAALIAPYFLTKSIVNPLQQYQASMQADPAGTIAAIHSLPAKVVGKTIGEVLAGSGGAFSDVSKFVTETLLTAGAPEAGAATDAKRAMATRAASDRESIAAAAAQRLERAGDSSGIAAEAPGSGSELRLGMSQAEVGQVLESLEQGGTPSNMSRSHLGDLLGRGGNKDVFAYGDSQAVGVLRAGKDPEILTEEMGLLQQLSDQGLPTVNARGPILVDDQPALLFDRFAQGSKDVVRLQDGKIRAVGQSSLLNQKSVSDLQGIRKTMVDKKIRINDLQFLIGQDGRVVVADPLGVQVGVAPSTNNLRMIDLLIKKAQEGSK